jgi:hypothetical protein
MAACAGGGQHDNQHSIAPAGASSLAATTPGAAAALSATPEVTVDDPVYDAIEQPARRRKRRPAAHEPPDALLQQLSHAEDNALLDWLQTPPTTLAMKEGRE